MRVFLLTFTAVIALAAAVARAADGGGDGIANELAAAKALHDAHKSGEALAAYEKILAQAPDNLPANGAVALYACDRGEWERALRCAEKCVTAEPQNAAYQYAWGAANGISALKAGVFSKFGYAKKCLAGYRRAAELAPRNLQYRWALLSYYAQAPGIVGGDMELAYGQAAEIKKVEEGNGRWAFVVLYVKEKKFTEAFHEYDAVRRERPDDVQLLNDFGRLTVMARERLDEGLVAFQRCLVLVTPPATGAMPSRADLHWQIGSVWELKKDFTAARSEYVLALKEDPNHQPAKRALENLGTRKS